MTTRICGRVEVEGWVLLTFGFFLSGEARNTCCLLVEAATRGDARLSQKLLPFI